MTGMIISILLLIFGTLLYTSVGVDIEWGTSAPLLVKLQIGWMSYVVYPVPDSWKREKAEKPKKKKEKPDDAGASESEDDEDKSGFKLSREQIFMLVKAGLRMIGRFAGSLFFELLEFRYVVAGDPDKAARRYGYVQAVRWTLEPLMAGAKRIGKREIASGIDFSAKSESVYLHVVVVIEAWQILYIGLAFAAEILNELYRER